jgi:hypothetical protein
MQEEGWITGAGRWVNCDSIPAEARDYFLHSVQSGSCTIGTWNSLFGSNTYTPTYMYMVWYLNKNIQLKENVKGYVL